VLTVPDAAPPSGACYPIVEVAHGTGGDAYDFLLDGTAGRLAARGLAGISLDQPLHGPRAEGQLFSVELASFNLFNPSAARATFRQSAIDTFSLTRFVRASLQVPAAKTPTGRDLCFDPTRVSFFGHSQGGLSGALAAALEDDIGSFVLSGAGGGFSITVLERKDIADFAALVRTFFRLDDDELLTDLHPVLTLIQTLVDVTDPINYAPHWLSGAPKDFLVTSGQHDEATPYRGAAAMAVAAGIPVVEPVVLPIPAYAWIGLPPATAPLSANAPGGRTAGFLQYTNDLPGDDMDTHFLIYHRPEAINASMRFLQSSAYTPPALLVRDPTANVQ
jgi:pimeloyl-ACP methyl ester carboxylesterase